MITTLSCGLAFAQNYDLSWHKITSDGGALSPTDIPAFVAALLGA